MGNSQNRSLRAVRTPAAMNRVRCVAIVAALALLGAGTAMAETITLTAAADPNVPSSFTLDFGIGFGRSTGHISLTDIEMEVDADTGAAQFVRYYQEVDPLFLPDGSSTGNLTIEIVDGSSTGTFNDLTGTFDTDDVYAIHFEGDLSAFGLQSPVMLPSSSAGFVSVSQATGGTITMDWAGFGQLANPFDPNDPLTFEYTCSSNAAFVPEAQTVVRLGIVPAVYNLQTSYATERRLIRDLHSALRYLNLGWDAFAAGWLRNFANDVDAFSPPISATDAEMLTGEARGLADELWTMPRATTK